MLGEDLGRTSFWTMFAGFNIAFFPMHISGLLGMPRRVYTYLPNSGLEIPNLLSTLGGVIFVIGIALTLINVWRSRLNGVIAGDNPWGADSLEWATSSPPPDYNFARLPIVSGRNPLWDGGVTPGPEYAEGRLTRRTSAMDATLEEAIEMPEDNLWAVVISVALLGLFAALLVRWYWVMGAFGILVLFSMARWMWPIQHKVMETDA
jgi:heme/copper-type cytochrome/quinol oxidase subunit 1